jgi:hypothetical protein
VNIFTLSIKVKRHCQDVLDDRIHSVDLTLEDADFARSASLWTGELFGFPILCSRRFQTLVATDWRKLWKDDVVLVIPKEVAAEASNFPL